MKTALIALSLGWLFAAGVVHAQVSIEVGSVDFIPGTTASMEVRLGTTRDDIGGTTNTIEFDPPVIVSNCEVNPEIGPTAAAFGYFPAGCQVGGDCRSVRAIVLLLDIESPFVDGVMLYSCDVNAPVESIGGEFPLLCTDPEAGTVDAAEADATCVDGVAVVRGDPTPTPTLAATPTFTVVPTETPTLVPACPADCNGNGVVSIEELVRAVRIALGSAVLADCLAASSDGDNTVSITDLVRAVRAALDGC